MAKKRRTTASQIAEGASAKPTMEQPSPIVRANLNRIVTVSPASVSLYANDVQVQLTPWDVRLTLGEIGDVSTDDNVNVTVRQIGDIRMSLPLTKKLTLILVQQLKNYEERIGKIALPAD